jgi:hypothetical protein
MSKPIRVLLDEGVPERLRRSFSEDFVVETVGFREWKGLKNGDPLRAAEKHFDALVTVDRGLRHQQNVSEHRIGVIVLVAGGTKLNDLLPLVPSVEATLRQLETGTVRVVAP